jgi:hypothetical protein
LEDGLIPSSLPAQSVVGIAAAVGEGAGKGEDVEMVDDAMPCKGAVVTIEDVSEMVSNTIKLTLFNPTQDVIYFTSVHSPTFHPHSPPTWTPPPPKQEKR